MTRPLFTRRMAMRSLGGALLGLPFLESLPWAHAGGAAAYPKRLVFLTTPNGTDPNAHWPTGTAENFTLSPILADLEPYHDRLLVLRGIDNRGAQETGINGHTDAVRCMLTGRAASNLSNDDYTAAGGISVDQFIANEVGAQTRFKSLEYVTDYIYEHAPNYVSFYAANQPAPFEDEPRKLFDRVFADFQVPADDPVALARLADRRSVLDGVYGNYAALQPRLASRDKERLDAHLEKVRELEQKLDAGAGLSCEIPAQPAEGQTDSSVGLDVLVQALACDLTRVATVRFDFWDSYGNLGVNGSYHDDYLHFVTQNQAAADVVQMVKSWQCREQILAFVDRLAAIPEGDGTLFDNTLVVWVDEFCHGYAHAHNEQPYVLLCGSDRFFPMGRYLQFDGVENNRLLNTFIDAMDCAGAGTFGDPSYNNNPLDLS